MAKSCTRCDSARAASGRFERICLVLVLIVMSVGCEGRDPSGPWLMPEGPRVSRPEAPEPSVGDDANATLSFAFPVGVNREFFALAALDGLYVGRDVSIIVPSVKNGSGQFGMVLSLGKMEVGANAAVGSVYALGEGSLPESMRIDGFVKVSSSVDASLVRPALGTLTVDPLVEWVSLLECDGDSTCFALPATDDNGQDLLPGAYDQFTLKEDTRRRLHSGSYEFGSLALEPNSALDIDNSNGPVFVRVHDELFVAGSINEYVLQPNVLFVYSGTSSPVLANAFRGTLVAPRAELFIPRTQTPHIGAFFAKVLVVEDGVRLEHRGFTPHGSRRSRIQEACDGCLARARIAARRCCDQANTSLVQPREAVAVCVAQCGNDLVCEATCRAEFALRSSNANTILSSCYVDSRTLVSGCLGDQELRPDVCGRLGYTLPPRRLDCSL